MGYDTKNQLIKLPFKNEEESEPNVKSNQAQPRVEIAEEIYHQNVDAG